MEGNSTSHSPAGVSNDLISSPGELAQRQFEGPNPSRPPTPACRGLFGDRARIALRMLTYIVYDGVADAAVATRDFARVFKVLVEMAIDEAVPPNLRGSMSAPRKFMEYLAPCGISSLTWFILRRVRRNQARTTGVERGVAVTTARGVWIVCHRILRQALICRLFTTRGSVEYNLTSTLAVLCTFFKEDLFAELHRPYRWFQHFSASQGTPFVAIAV